MKPIKMFSLPVLAALMAMAFVGAGSAMAESTALCGSDEEVCQAITHVHETSITKGLLLGAVKVECDVLFLGDVEKTGAPLEILGHFTYTNCKTSGGTACTVGEVAGTDAKISVLKTAHELSSVTGNGEVTVKCGVLINCTYNGTGLEGHGKGPLLSEKENGEVRLEEQTTNKVKGFCPETAKLDLLTTPLEATYLGPAELLYCVLYLHNTNGFYAASDCKGTPVAGNEYDLMGGPAGWTVGLLVCISMWSGGLWVERVSTHECKKDAATLKGGTYEHGTITAAY